MALLFLLHHKSFIQVKNQAPFGRDENKIEMINFYEKVQWDTSAYLV